MAAGDGSRRLGKVPALGGRGQRRPTCGRLLRGCVRPGSPVPVSVRCHLCHQVSAAELRRIRETGGATRALTQDCHPGASEQRSPAATSPSPPPLPAKTLGRDPGRGHLHLGLCTPSSLPPPLPSKARPHPHSSSKGALLNLASGICPAGGRGLVDLGGPAALLSFQRDLGEGPCAERRQGRRAGGGIAEPALGEVHECLQTALGCREAAAKSGPACRGAAGRAGGRVREPRGEPRSAAPRPPGCAPAPCASACHAPRCLPAGLRRLLA